MSRRDELVAEVEANGWTVRFQEYCEDAETPGLLGMYGGVCMHLKKTIKVKLHGMSDEQIIAVLEHEIEHMNGARWGTDHPHLGLKCGGRCNGWGDPID